MKRKVIRLSRQGRSPTPLTSCNFISESEPLGSHPTLGLLSERAPSALGAQLCRPRGSSEPPALSAHLRVRRGCAQPRKNWGLPPTLRALLSALWFWGPLSVPAPF